MNNNIKFYKVGGCVRDEILGLKPKDIDFTVVAPSYNDMKREIISLGGDIKVEKPEFLTIRAVFKDGIFGKGGMDFVLARKDGAYFDGRRPENTEPGTIYDDLARRDFTVNSIAKDVETSEIIDPHNGLSDINQMTLRTVGNPQDRFNEDYLRMLRAVRFHITKGFSLCYELSDCLEDKELVSKLQTTAIERVYDELLKCFQKNTAQSVYILFEKFPLLGHYCFRDGLWLKPSLEQRV